MRVKDDKSVFLEPLLRLLRIRKVKKYIPYGARLLDLGCGFDGNFLRSIKNHISLGVGVDKKIECKSSDNLFFIKSSFDDLDLIGQRSFDCVTLLAVIEHLDNPEEFITRISLFVKQGGIFIITTPTPCAKPVLNFLSFRLGVVSREEIGDHKRYFGKRDLTTLLKRCNFRVIKYAYFELGFNSLCIAKYIGLSKEGDQCYFQ